MNQKPMIKKQYKQKELAFQQGGNASSFFTIDYRKKCLDVDVDESLW